MNKLAEVLRNDKIRERINSILDAYSKLDKSSLILKQDLLFDDLNNTIDRSAAVALANFLDTTGDETSELISLVKDKEGKEHVKDIAARFNPVFAGYYTSYADAWFRIYWSSSFEFATKKPVIELKILKNSGQTLFLTMPLENHAALINQLLYQLDSSIELVNDDDAISMKPQIEYMQQAMESIAKKMRLTKAPKHNKVKQ
jgi:hypothetical protein